MELKEFIKDTVTQIADAVTVKWWNIKISTNH